MVSQTYFDSILPLGRTLDVDNHDSLFDITEDQVHMAIVRLNAS